MTARCLKCRKFLPKKKPGSGRHRLYCDETCRIHYHRPPNGKPRGRPRKTERNAEVVKMRQSGAKLLQIAAAFCISHQRVMQILRKADE